MLATKFQSLERGAGADEDLVALKRKMGMLPPEEAPTVRAEVPKRVKAPSAPPPAASNEQDEQDEQDELAAALEEMEAEQNQEQQRKAGR